MHRIISIIGYSILLIFTMHCVSIPAPIGPVSIELQKIKPQAEREKTYQNNLIDSKGTGYTIGGTRIGELQLEPLFAATYVGENTKTLKNSHDSWSTAAGIPRFLASLSTIGSMAGTIVLVGSSASSGKTPEWGLIGLAWGITAAWWAIYIPLAVVTSNKLTAATESYNADLARALDLQQKTSNNPVPQHGQYAHHTLAWGLRF